MSIEDIPIRSTAEPTLKLGKGHLTMPTNPSRILRSGSLIQASELCGTQDQAHLLGLPLFQAVFALSELLAITREWHRRHRLPNCRTSVLTGWK